MIKINKEDIENAIKISKSMMEAASKLNVQYSTFKRHATKYGLWNPNQSGKGIIKNFKSSNTPLQEILDGKHPQYHTFKLKLRLISELNWEQKCSVCGLLEWNENKIPLELDHIDGNKYNHKIENLRLICPNCHAQTPTYRSRNKSSGLAYKYNLEYMIDRYKYLKK